MANTRQPLHRARALEREGRLDDALAAYTEAFEASGQDPALAADIGRLALRMGLPDIAEQLLRIALAADPEGLESRLALAHALRDLHRYDEAVALLSEDIQAHPDDAGLWTTLAMVLVQQGEADKALVFLEEALRLQPGFGRALYYRANARADLGDPRGAVADYDAALSAADLPDGDRERVRFALALSLLSLGELEAGWEAYRARLSPMAANPVAFDIAAEPLAFDPGDGIEGKSLLLMAEQGLGDEIMFANMSPDVLRALGPHGKLAIAVERRLVPLFARSFPDAAVVEHHTARADGRAVRSAPALTLPVDAWSPMAAPARRFRRSAADFPRTPGYLTPDPDRVAHWRGLLAGLPGRKVGILWKSLKLHGERARQFAPFDLWAPVLRAPGVTVVNLQYGDCAPELSRASDRFGVDIWRPPGLDLNDDLDDVAALTCALDLTVGFANATLNLAGACGAPAWLITPGASWTKLGTDRYPWYPQVRCFSAVQAGGWEAVMDQVASALGGL
jgi:cytochrome c-type biogenesis protein CcmH/NrfG